MNNRWNVRPLEPCLRRDSEKSPIELLHNDILQACDMLSKCFLESTPHCLNA